MNSRYDWDVFARNMLVGVLCGVLAGWSRAQALADVPPDAGYGGLIVVVILAIVGGLVYLKLKKPATFDKVMLQARDVQHTLGPALEKAKAEVSTQIHAFEAKVPARAPAIAPTPTSPAMQAAAASVAARPTYTTEQMLSDAPLPGEQPIVVVGGVIKF